MKICAYLVLFLLLPSIVIAQRIDNTASFRDMGKDRYFRFLYDNDFFSATDLYYTQGYTLELVTPVLRHNPVNYILPKLDGKAVYGLAFEQTGFIPTDISDPDIRYGDRPYAATIAFKSFITSTDTLRKSRLTSSLTVGMIGQAALGYEIQSGIHKWIDDEEPMGWGHQIRNDIALDYELAYEKQLFRLWDFFAVTSASRIRLGTLNTHLATGFNATLGLVNTPFASSVNRKKLQLYIFSQPMAMLVGYDATLQGGLFNNSPYTIPAGDVERVILQNNYGMILQYRSLYLEYSRNDITREFKSGKAHAWGGFKVGFTF
ncbi:MAG: lipid A deacylase LpxR family protein [Flavobacterium sp.]